MRKWLILDRDGVINHDSDQFIKNPDEWQPIAGSLEAMAALNLAGYRIVVITNQSGIARGLFDLDTLTQIHRKFKTLLKSCGGEVEHIYFCPHGPDDHCECRKPKSGLFHQFAQDYDLSLESIYAVGDSIRDLEAALGAGARAVLVRTGKGKNSEASIAAPKGDQRLKNLPVFDNLSQFSQTLLKQA